MIKDFKCSRACYLEVRETYDSDFQKKLLPVVAKNLRIFEARSGKRDI
jgi:hypothetical protein